MNSFANISILTDCNNNCPYCFQQDYHGKHKYMDIDQFKEILNWCGDVSEIGLLGGEPTLHPNLLKFVDEVQDRNIRVSLLTNALLDNDALWEELLKRRIYYLVNCNHNEKYNNIFKKNLDKLLSSPMTSYITLGITLIGDAVYDNASIDYIEYLINAFSHISLSIRIGIATPYNAKYKILDYSNQITRLINIIERSLSYMAIDCAINCCNIDSSVFGRILYSSKIMNPEISHCMGSINSIRLDGSVLYCDSLDDIKVDSYKNYKNLNECIAELNRQKDEMLKNIPVYHMCNKGVVCNNKICTGPCPAILNRLYKQSLEESDNE